MGSFFTSRLKRAGSLSEKNGRTIRADKKMKKNMENKNQKRKKSMAGRKYLSLRYSMSSSAVRSLLHSYMGLFNFSDFDF
jgi:hypothetical protein